MYTPFEIQVLLVGLGELVIGFFTPIELFEDTLSGLPSPAASFISIELEDLVSSRVDDTEVIAHRGPDGIEAVWLLNDSKH